MRVFDVCVHFEPRPDDRDLWCQESTIEILVSFPLSLYCSDDIIGILPNISWNWYALWIIACVDALNCSDSHFCSEEVVPTVEQIHHSFGPTLPGRKWWFLWSLSLILPPSPSLSPSLQRSTLNSSTIFFSFVAFSLHFPSGACQRSQTFTRSARPLTSPNLNPSACWSSRGSASSVEMTLQKQSKEYLMTIMVE